MMDFQANRRRRGKVGWLVCSRKRDQGSAAGELCGTAAEEGTRAVFFFSFKCFSLFFFFPPHMIKVCRAHGTAFSSRKRDGRCRRDDYVSHALSDQRLDGWLNEGRIVSVGDEGRNHQARLADG